jgi:hypothetical protein
MHYIWKAFSLQVWRSTMTKTCTKTIDHFNIIATLSTTIYIKNTHNDSRTTNNSRYCINFPRQSSPLQYSRYLKEALYFIRNPNSLSIVYCLIDSKYEFFHILLQTANSTTRSDSGSDAQNTLEASRLGNFGHQQFVYAY